MYHPFKLKVKYARSISHTHTLTYLFNLAPSSKYPEKDIKVITDMGVSREEAINALEMAGGNPDLAASLLF